MGDVRVSKELQERVEDAFHRLGHNITAIAKDVGCARSAARECLRQSGLYDIKIADGRLRALETQPAPVMAKGQIKRYIVTSAQNNTPVAERVLNALRMMAKHYDAELLCGSFNYNVGTYGKLSAKRGGHKAVDRDLWFDPEIEPLLDNSDRSIELFPGLVWCGEMNILPTAKRPLTGFSDYTGRASSIFPHAKIAMESVASAKHADTKLMYTTGTVTQRNYIKKRAGLEGEKRHSYAGLIVEGNDSGWWVRMLEVTDDGVVQDLDVIATPEKVTTGNPVLYVNCGDIHSQMIDPLVDRAMWDIGGLIDRLKPRYQFLHDILDFRARNHHDKIDPHRMFKRFVNEMDNVENEVQLTADFLTRAVRPFCETLVVDSNHDNAMSRWLRETDYRKDPLNAKYFLESQLAVYSAIQDHDDGFHLVEWAMQRAECPPEVSFLRADDEYILGRGSALHPYGIDNGMHGHLGVNGSRASPRQFAKMGRPTNTQHTHSAGWIDDSVTGGTSSLLDMEFNTGPSSWSHSHILGYENGGRTILTMWKGHPHA